jgi:glycosyltransferase involved in cell wall biosynthesis
MEALSPNKGLISCILPVYNSEAYLGEAIDSILSQSYENFELIIINDGSTDRSGEIVEKFDDHRIRCRYQQNAGIVTALNHGLSLACGEFIARMDADDISLPDRFEKQVSFLTRNPEVVLVGGRSIPIDSEGNIDETKIYKKVLKHEKRTTTDFSIFPPRVATALHPLIMMRSSAIRAIGGYRHGFKHAEDYDMYIRISQHGYIHNLEDVLLKYRFHGKNVSIENTSIQERNAALSELDNMRRFKSAPNLKNHRICEKTFDGYVELRAFRRELGLSTLNYSRALTALKFIIIGAPGTEIRVSIRIIAMWSCNILRSIFHIITQNRRKMRL